MPRLSHTFVALGALLAVAAARAADPSVEAILARVSEEAETFRRGAKNVIGQETLKHKGRRSKPRFRLRVGESARNAPAPSYLTREVVSEYGFGAFADNPESLHEFRKVVSVDGRQVLSRVQARTTLATNMRSADDRELRRILQEFERQGTSGATTDCGLMILLFERPRLSKYDFTFGGSARMGADEAWIVRYKQHPGPDGLNVFQGRELVRIPMSGEIWVRKQGLAPLRVSMRAEAMLDGAKVIYSAVTEYTMSSRGLLLPASVRYTETDGGVIHTDNLYQYSGFHFFAAEAEIKFTPVEPQP